MDKDYIEFGAGNQSKVIGKDNTVSEYMTTVMALLALMGQVCFGIFVVSFLVLYFLGLTWQWSLILGGIVAVVPPFGVASLAFSYMTRLKSINEPLPVRDENGRFRKTKVSVNTKHVADIITADNGDTEWVERWGGAG